MIQLLDAKLVETSFFDNNEKLVQVVCQSMLKEEESSWNKSNLHKEISASISRACVQDCQKDLAERTIGREVDWKIGVKAKLQSKSSWAKINAGEE